MANYSEETYGERVAGIYDHWFPDHDPQAIDALAQLAGDGRALELGVGTGRFALPLSARGVEVYGIDAAPAMLSKLSAKQGADRINVTQGNFADVAVDGQFSLIYIIFNTLFALGSRDEQVRCFRNVAARLAPFGSESKKHISIYA